MCTELFSLRVCSSLATAGYGVFQRCQKNPRRALQTCHQDQLTPRHERTEKIGGVRSEIGLPLGTVFPFDFGSIAGTIADDGDPLDALVLMDEPAFVGCLVESRVIGVIEANQTEHGKTERNDRIIAVAAESHTHRDIKSLGDLNQTLLEEIEHFFVSYNQQRGKKFELLGHRGPKRARSLVYKHTRKGKR